jgi:hypothetical protein
MWWILLVTKGVPHTTLLARSWLLIFKLRNNTESSTVTVKFRSFSSVKSDHFIFGSLYKMFILPWTLSLFL